nr:uncharacterized protein LOC124809408 [Hydra vulgaris]
MASSILPETTLPSLKVKINGMLRTALIDSGCSITVIHAKSTHGLVLKSQKLITTLGGAVHVLGETVIKLEIDGIHRVVNSLVVKEKPFGFDLILGMNAIEKFGGVIIYGNKNRTVQMLAYDTAKCGVVTTTIKNKNDINDIKCDVKNTNKENKRNEIKCANFAANFDGKKWTASWNWNKEPVIDNTICEYKMSHEYERSYRKEINEWNNSGILVPYNELTLGPPKVLIPLTCVVQENKDKKVRPVGDFQALNELVNCDAANADVCQENCFVGEKLKMQKFLILKKPTSKFILIKDSGYIKRAETAENVAKHLHKFGLQYKPPQNLEQGRVLGLRVKRNKNRELIWKRDDVVQFEPLNAVTRSQLFSKLEDCKEKLKDLFHRVEKEDLVGGKWLVPVNAKAELYCDASSIGLGVVLLIGGVVVEDATWLRPASDTYHINISELDSILRGLNLARWLNAVLKEEYCVKTRGISQLLVQRQLNTIKEVAKGIQIVVQWIPSEINLADRLSRFPQKWCRTVCAVGLPEQKDI